MAAICGYSWRRRYGDQLNTALASYATPALQRSRRWSPARTAAVNTEWQTNRPVADCGLITGGLLPDVDPQPGHVLHLRFSASTTVASVDAPTPSTAGVAYYLTVQPVIGRWKVSSDTPPA